MGRENLIGSFKGVIDSTLREGMQFVDANFTLQQQKQIVENLTQVGVDRIEVSNPASEHIFKDLRELIKIPNRPIFLAHVRNKLSDIQVAIDIGVEGVNILCNSMAERLKSMGISFEDHLSTLQQSIMTAQNKGLEVRVGSEHYFSAIGEDKERALQIYRVADELNVDRISVPDTKGIANPWDVAEEISFLRSIFKADLEVHFHNDYFQSVSNGLVALQQGANWVDTTIGGIGERSGITPLSIMLVALEGINPSLVRKYHLEHLISTDKLLAEMVGREVPYNMITSKNGFTHKAGLHLNGVQKQGPSLYEAIPPGKIGADRNLVIGSPISGRTTQTDVDNFYQTYGTK